MILRVSYKDHVTNEENPCKIQQAIEPHKDHGKETQTAALWSCLTFIRSGQTILQGTVKGGRRQGRQRKRWEDIRERTSHEFAKSQGAVENRRKWRKLVEIICGASSILVIKG